jgi:hypothetical protein
LLILVVPFLVDPIEFYGIGPDDFEFCLAVGAVDWIAAPQRQI